MKHPMQCAKCFRACRLSSTGKTWVCTICKHREKANGGQAVSEYMNPIKAVGTYFNNEPLLTIHCDGRVTTSDKLKPDEISALVLDQIKTQWMRDGQATTIRELQERIQRLVEAGDALKAAGYFGGFNDAVDKWIKVKEAKP